MRSSSRKRRVFAIVFVLGALFVWAFAPVLARLDYRAFPGRASWQRPGDVIEAMRLSAGTRVADLGAGDGYFTFLLAEAVGSDGRVFAVDVTEDIVEELERRAHAEGVSNVEVIHGGVDDPKLPDGQVDVVFICNVYHHIGDRVPYFAALRSDLSPEGRIVIVEVAADSAAKWLSPPGHATSLASLEDEMSAAGYRLVETRDFLPVQNFVVFEPVP